MRLEWRVAGSNALLLVLAVGASLGAAYRIERRAMRSRLDEERRLDMARLAGICRDTLQARSETILLNYLRHVIEAPEVLGAGLWDMEGRVHIHSDFIKGDYSRVRRTTVESFLGEAARAAGPLERVVSKDGRAVLRSAMPVLSREGRFGSVVVDYDLDRVEAGLAGPLRRSAVELALSGLLILAAALAAALALAGALARPLRGLSEAARRMASGAAPELPVSRADEIGDIARDLAAMTNRLKEVDRLKDQFLHSVSHDMRTPLAVIQSSLYHARKTLRQDPGGVEEDLLDMERAFHDLVKFVNNILDLAKLQSGRIRISPQRVDVAALLEETRQGFRRVAEDHGLSLKVDVPAALPAARADRELVARVLSNLVMNAIKFTPRGGRILVAAGPDGTAVRLTVRDTGIGIPPERIEAVFERFEQAGALPGSQHPGTGLGLAICKEIIERHGGRIWVESAPGKGSAFHLTLPAEGGPS